MKIKRSASMSEDGNYRWLLVRRWDSSKHTLRWILLNPSKADGEYDTPTIERVIFISKILGYGGCIVVNLYAWRSPTPTTLRGMGQAKAIGSLNDGVLKRCGQAARRHNQPVMVAWGTSALHSRVTEVITQYFWGLELLSLGTNAKGQPFHPNGGVLRSATASEIKHSVGPWCLEELHT